MGQASQTMGWLKLAAAAVALGLSSTAAEAQSRKDTLMVLVESGPNNLDIQGVGTSFRSYVASWNTHDRLITFETKTLPDGTQSYDYTKMKGELAESYVIAPDGMSVTFKLRPGATFHDGSPVTAKDVKWSYDRAVSVGGFPTFQMSAGSLTKVEQFEVIDDSTFKVNFWRKDKLSLPDMAVPVAAIYNSKVAMQHATDKDPWALEWLKSNIAAGGAYKLEKWAPGQETIFTRFDEWKNGPLPAIKRVILREVPSAGNRRALLERGDGDVSVDLPPKDMAELKQSGKFNVVGVPVENSLLYVGFAVKVAPFDNVKVRQALAWAIPYEAIMKNAVYGRGVPMFGGAADGPKTADWPQAFPYKTDLAKAKALLTDAGFPSGFETSLSIDLGDATVSEPAAVLLQESLAQIGVKATINKVPGANWRAALLKKDLPIHIASFGGWLNFPDYWFYWGYHSQNGVFNTMSYQNPEMDKYIDEARFNDDPAKYQAAVKQFIRMSMDEVPRVPLYQQFMDVGFQKNITGFKYWFHRQLDFRQLVKN